MSNSELPPLPREPVPLSKGEAQPAYPGIVFGIARVQEWTLGLGYGGRRIWGVDGHPEHEAGAHRKIH